MPLSPARLWQSGRPFWRLPGPDAQNPAIVRTLVEGGAGVQFVGELRHSLEDIYLEMIRQEETH